MQCGADLIAWQRFLNWLEQYLADQEIAESAIWNPLRRSQRSIAFQIKFGPVKHLIRRVLPLRARYWLRDRWINLQSLRRSLRLGGRRKHRSYGARVRIEIPRENEPFEQQNHSTPGNNQTVTPSDA
jgi:hypothetical protein